MPIAAELLDEGEKDFDEVIKGEKEPAKEPDKKADVEPGKDGEEVKTYEKEYKSTQTALRQEREEKKRLNLEAEELRRQFVGLESLRKELDDHRQEKQRLAQEELYQKDPAAFLRQQNEETRRHVAGMAEVYTKDRAQQSQMEQFRAVVSSHEQAFQAEKPDYLEAVEYVKASELKEMEAMGIPEEQRGAILQQRAAMFAADSLRRGISPAKAAYDIAVHRGYKRAEAKQNAGDKIEQLEKGMKAAQTLTKGTKSGSGK